MSLNNRFVSVVLPVHDAGPVPSRLAELHALLDERCANYEIVLVDDGCSPPLEKVLAIELRTLRCLRVLTLSCAFGGEAAIRAGLQSAIGDVVVVMELALDPVGGIPEMLALTEKGHGVVIGVPESRFDEYPLRRLFSRMFHGLNRVFTGTEMYPGSSWFRALSRSALNALVVSQYDSLPFRHATVSIGFNPVVLKYRRAPVSGRAPRPSFFKDVRQGLDVLFTESSAPLTVMTLTGCLGALVSMLFLLPLWFLLFVFLTVFGQYVHRKLARFQSRPAYIVMNEASSAVEVRDAGRRNIVSESI